MKPLFIISCPIDTYSGYGARSRDVVKAIIELDKYNVKVLPQRWGNCPWGFINDHPEKWSFLTSHLLPVGNQLPQQPEIWAQITVPNEFQPVGKYNIGFTAGIETTICPAEWIQGLNKMDMNFVSSNHSKEVILNSKFEQRDKDTNNLMSIIEIEKPIEVLFEGADLNTYLPKKSTFNLDQVKEDFAYLFVGHWMQGHLGEDRKNVALLIQTFFEKFKNKKKAPALILKTSGAGASYMDREVILNKINQIASIVKAKNLPNVYILHGELSDEEINELYNHKKVKAMVSLTKGEGFGRPLLEFSLTKKPIIATNWSGHIDFLSQEFVPLVNGQLSNVHQSASNQFLLKESKWFSPSPPEFAHYLEDVFSNYKHYKEKSTRQAYKSKTEFSYEKMRDKLKKYFEVIDVSIPQQTDLVLPSLTL